MAKDILRERERAELASEESVALAAAQRMAADIDLKARLLDDILTDVVAAYGELRKAIELIDASPLKVKIFPELAQETPNVSEILKLRLAHGRVIMGAVWDYSAPPPKIADRLRNALRDLLTEEVK